LDFIVIVHAHTCMFWLVCACVYYFKIH